MLQMANAITWSPQLRSRATDLCELRGDTIRIFNNMRDQIDDLPEGQEYPDSPDAFFILGGYSWKMNRFRIWLLHFDAHQKKFTYRRAKKWKGVRGHKQICLTGSNVVEAKQRIIDLLRKRKRLSIGGFDMEPFEVLRDMIRDDRYKEIGGPPQMIKIYRSMNTRPYSIFWPNRESLKVSFLGRQLLDYEKIDSKVLDPDSLELEDLPPYSLRKINR